MLCCPVYITSCYHSIKHTLLVYYMYVTSVCISMLSCLGLSNVGFLNVYAKNYISKHIC